MGTLTPAFRVKLNGLIIKCAFIHDYTCTGYEIEALDDGFVCICDETVFIVRRDVGAHSAICCRCGTSSRRSTQSE
jgi:hypothetical protein